LAFRTFSDAKTFVHSLKLKNLNEWWEYCKSGRKPNDIPSAPHLQYKYNGWINYGDWLGTNFIATRNRKFRPFKEAREYAQSLHLSNVREWEKYCSSGEKPNDIPRLPNRVYKDKGWINWGDWLGTYTIAPFNINFRALEVLHKLRPRKYKYKEYITKIVDVLFLSNVITITRE